MIMENHPTMRFSVLSHLELLVPKIVTLQSSSSLSLFCDTHCTDSMPICSVGGSLYNVRFDPKYAGKANKNIKMCITTIVQVGPLCPLLAMEDF